MGLIVDLFAGGGGASTGIEWELGRSPDIAINHDPMALAMHKANHPDTRHLVENVWHVRPREIVGDNTVDLLWASPDCTHFSKAKGGAPKRDINRAKRSRGLAWVILRWADQVRPRLIFMENVEEWIDWCPMLPDGKPDPKRKGETRRRFVRQLEKRGYAVQITPKDKACDHGAPTIRQRLVMVARCDGQPIVVPRATHGRNDGVRDIKAGKVKPYRTAAEIIDWSIPCPSIFTRSKELAPATKRRIARGMQRFVIDAARPFIVPITRRGDDRVHGIDDPLRTVTTAHRGEHAVARPFMARCDHTSAADRNGIHALSEPVRTITTAGVGAVIAPFTAGIGGPTYSGKPRGMDVPFATVLNENHSGLIAAFLAGCGGRAALSPERSVHAPLGTVTAKADQIVVAPFVTRFRAENAGSPIGAPLPTVTANSFIKRPGGAVPLGIAAAFMAQHNTAKTGVNPGRDLRLPVSTIVNSGSHQSLVAATITHLRGGGRRYGFPVNSPLPALTAQGTHVGLSAAFLTKYYSEGGTTQGAGDPLHTIPTKAHFSLVTTEAGVFPMTAEELAGAKRVAQFMRDYCNDNAFEGVEFVCAAGVPIVDIGMRMLDLRELYRAQGFPDSYIIAPDVYRIVRGKLVYGPLPKTDGTRMCGNSVSPYQARAWIRANAPREFYAPRYGRYRRAA